MGTVRFFAFAVLGISAALAACSADDGTSGKTAKPSSSSSGGSTSSSGGVSSSGGDDGNVPKSGEVACVEKGAKGNAAGVGAYCDKSVKCPSGAICTGDFGAPEGAQFCTKICNTDSDCGEGAFCFSEERGKGCVTNACKGN